MKLYAWSLGLLVAASVAAACRGAGAVRADVAGRAGLVLPAGSQEPTAAPAPTDSVIAGCAGGFSGGGGGAIVTGRGEVIRWSRFSSADRKQYQQLRVDTAAAGAIFRELARIRFREIQSDRDGGTDVACSLELTGTSGSHMVSWPLGEPPAAVRPVYERLRALAPGSLHDGR